MSFTVSVETQRSSEPAAAKPSTEAELFAAARLLAIQELLGDPAILSATCDTISRLAPDPGSQPALCAWLEQGITSKDRRFELRSAVRAVARAITPRTYLEVGTQRGWSLAQVAAEAPDARVYSVDLWVPNYGGIENPGPEFVHSEICRVAPGFRGKITYVDGNSHDVLPVLLDGCHDPMNYPDELNLVRESENRPRRFDLITVDGDHTAIGAWWDLHDLLPRVALGGALVFGELVDQSDDLRGESARCLRPPRVPTPTDLAPSLMGVWQRIQPIFPDFVFLDRLRPGASAGIAVRVR